MSKEELLKKKLPDVYCDCSGWFEEGMDTIPSLLDFSILGRDKREYDKFQKLYSIENMKKCIKGNEESEELKEARLLIDKAIQEYNEM